MFIIFRDGRIYTARRLEDPSGELVIANSFISTNAGILFVTNTKSTQIAEYIKHGKKALIGVSGMLRGTLLGGLSTVYHITIEMEATGIKSINTQVVPFHEEDEIINNYRCVKSHRSDVSDYIEPIVRSKLPTPAVFKSMSKSMMIRSSMFLTETTEESYCLKDTLKTTKACPALFNHDYKEPK